MDAVAGEEGDGSLQEGDRGRCFLVGEHFSVGEATVVVDGDVNELPADRAALAAAPVGAARPIAAGEAAADPFAGAALDPAELLDVDVHDLARTGALVAQWLLQPDPAQPAHAAALEHSRYRRDRHRECLGDLRRRHPQLPQTNDHGDPLRGGAVGDALRGRRSIDEAGFTGGSVATNPLASAAHAHPSGRSRLGQRPALLEYTHRQQPATAPTESRVTVKPHPVASFGLRCLRQLSESSPGTWCSSSARLSAAQAAVSLRVSSLSLCSFF